MSDLGAILGAFWGQLGAILAETGFVYERSEGLAGLNGSKSVPEKGDCCLVAETGFVYERSEGLAGLNDSKSVPEKGDCCIVADFEPSWGHPLF